MKSCFLFGHSDAPQDIQSAIETAVERQYLNHGIRQYYVGSFGSFDRMAASALKAAKKRYQDISLYLLLPYRPAERPVETPEGFDGTFYPPLEKVPRRDAIVRANRYMIETCDTQLGKEKDASKESVLRRLELEQQVRELENAQKILEAIPEDVLAQYRTAVKEENAYSHQK